jgi:hypothetical protein
VSSRSVTIRKTYTKHPREDQGPTESTTTGVVEPVKLYRFMRLEPPQSSVELPWHAMLQNGPFMPAWRTGGVPEMPLSLPTNIPPLRICEPHPA